MKQDKVASTQYCRECNEVVELAEDTFPIITVRIAKNCDKIIKNNGSPHTFREALEALISKNSNI